MKVGVAKETAAGERRVALVPESLGKLTAAGLEILVEQGYGSVINAVNFGGKPIEPPPYDETGRPAGGPANRRAELYVNLRKALEGRFSLPDRVT